MKTLRWTIPSLALAALLAGGCILLSGQWIFSYDLPDPVAVASPTAVTGTHVDLNTLKIYDDHKENLKDVVDVAILGEFENTSPSVAVDIEVWMTPNVTSYTTAAEVRGDDDAICVWGPLRIPLGGTRKVGWDQSAALFGKGKAPLLAQIKGDGVFTLYVLGASGNYSFRLNHGVLTGVISAGT